MFDSYTSASTSRDFISAIVTTAVLEVVLPPNGATISPTSAFFVSTVPSNGARINVFSIATSYCLILAFAISIEASNQL